MRFLLYFYFNCNNKYPTLYIIVNGRMCFIYYSTSTTFKNQSWFRRQEFLFGSDEDHSLIQVISFYHSSTHCIIMFLQS